MNIRGNFRVSHIRRGEVEYSGQRKEVNLMMPRIFFERHQFKISENKEYFDVGFYEPFEENGKKTDLNWNLCTFFYETPPDKIKDGMTGTILYNKRNTSYFWIHVVTSHKNIFHPFFLTWMSNRILWLVMMPPPLREVWKPLFHVGKL